MNSPTQVNADLAVLRASSPQDFDGHTEFYRLTPSQRLAWLDEAVAFINAAKSASRSSAQDPGGSNENLRLRKVTCSQGAVPMPADVRRRLQKAGMHGMPAE